MNHSASAAPATFAETPSLPSGRYLVEALSHVGTALNGLRGRLARIEGDAEKIAAVVAELDLIREAVASLELGMTPNRALRAPSAREVTA